MERLLLAPRLNAEPYDTRNLGLCCHSLLLLALPIGVSAGQHGLCNRLKERIHHQLGAGR